MKRKALLSLLFLLFPLLLILSYSYVPEKPLNAIVQQLSRFQAALPAEKVYLHVDRPFYKPGEDIWFGAYLLDGTTHRPSAISEIMYVQLINPKGNVEKELSLIVREGRARGDFQLSSTSPGGIYKLKAFTRWMQNQGADSFFEKEIQVQAVVYPQLLMKLDFEKKAYGPGDEVSAKLEVHTLEKSPVAQHPLHFSVKLKGQEIFRKEEKTNREGISYLKFKLPDSLPTLDALLNIQLAHGGKKEAISRSVPVVLNNIDLQFFPEGGEMVAGLQSRIAFKALNEWRKPADVEGYIMGDDGQKIAAFESYHQGMGAVSFTPERGRHYQAVITRPVGKKDTFYHLPEAKDNGFSFKVDKEKEQLRLSIYATDSEPVKVVAQCRGEILYTKKIKATAGKNELLIPAGEFPAGVVQLTLFDAQNRPLRERLVFVNGHKNLSVEITSDKEKYLPREQVKLRIQVKDGEGNPAPANLSLAVADDKLLSFADDRQDHILSYLLLSSDVRGKVEEPAFYFDPEEPKAAQALDYLLMTQGWRRFKWEEVLAGEGNGGGQLLQAPEKAILKGRVINYWGEDPVEGVKVKVLETGDSVYTNAQGRFLFEKLNLCRPHTLLAEINGRQQRIEVNSYAQDYMMSDQISGMVMDEKGNALGGANILIKGTNTGTVADSYGRFAMGRPQEGMGLLISFPGFKTREVTLEGKVFFDILLKADRNVLYEGAGRRRDTSWRWPEDQQLLQVPVTEQPVPPQMSPEITEVPDREETEEGNDPDMEFQVADMVVMEESVIENIVFERAPAEEVQADRIYEVVEEQPTPAGGMEEFYKMVGKRLRYPKQAYEKGIEGRVYVQFVVDQSGNVRDVKTVKGLGHGCDEAAEKVIRKSSWVPGKQRGRPVEVRMVMPVMFKLYGERRGAYVVSEDELEIVVARQHGSTSPEGSSFYYCGREFYSPVYEAGEQAEERTDFRKTIYWNPDVRIGASGETTLSFFTSDEITSFKAIAEGIGKEGAVGRGVHTLYTQLPVFMEGKIPPVLTFEDKLSIPVLLKNNTGKTISGTLEITPPENILFRTKQQTVSLKAGEGRTLYLKGEVQSRAGSGEIKISFKGKGFEDAFVRSTEVVPKGFPMEVSYAGKSLDSRYKFTYDRALPHTLRATVTAYPNMLSELMQGVESILREPYGCFEQTSSSTYPNVLALQYLNESGQVNFEVKRKAEDLIRKGYEKLISFETAEQGYEWFGAVPPHESLTAYGLMEFSDMEEVYAGVDPKMMDRTRSWLLSRRDGKGGFSKGFAKYAFGRANQEVSNAYITYALSESKNRELEKEWQNIYQEVRKSGDAYRLGLVANTAFNLQKKEEGAKLLAEIQSLLKKHGFGSLPADHSFTYSQGKSLQTETAALLLMAFLEMPETYMSQIQEGAKFLLTSRTGYGGFGSTQATIMALKALTEYAKFSKRTAEAGIIEVYVNGQKAAVQAYEKDHKGEIRVSVPEKWIGEGESDIRVQFKGTREALPHSLGISWTGYTPPADPACKVALSTVIHQKEVKQGETSRLEVRLKNTTAEGLPMIVAQIGIPSGLSVQSWQLKELSEKGVFDFYEINKNYLLLYYRGMAPDAVKEISLDLKTEIPGAYESAASSAYLYYTNEHKNWQSGTKVEVRE